MAQFTVFYYFLFDYWVAFHGFSINIETLISDEASVNMRVYKAWGKWPLMTMLGAAYMIILMQRQNRTYDSKYLKGSGFDAMLIFLCFITNNGCHAAKSAGKFEFDELDLNKTLLENGVIDESDEFEDLDLPGDYYVPVLHVYWNDDLTIA